MPFITTTRFLTLTLLTYAGGIITGKFLAAPPLLTVALTIGYIVSCYVCDTHSDRRILYGWLLAILFGLGTLNVQLAMKNPIPNHTRMTSRGRSKGLSHTRPSWPFKKSVRDALRCK